MESGAEKPATLTLVRLNQAEKLDEERGALIVATGLLRRLQGKGDSIPPTFAQDTEHSEHLAMQAIAGRSASFSGSSTALCSSEPFSRRQNCQHRWQNYIPTPRRFSKTAIWLSFSTSHESIPRRIYNAAWSNI